jgi:ABC-type multidrug transport system permease subunit
VAAVPMKKKIDLPGVVEGRLDWHRSSVYNITHIFMSCHQKPRQNHLSKAVEIKTIMLCLFCMGIKLGLWYLNVHLLTIFVILIFVYICSVIETSSIISIFITVMLFTCFLNNCILPPF